MAAGDKYFTCDNINLPTEFVMRDMVVQTSDGKPAWRTYETNGSGEGSSPSLVVRTPSMVRSSASSAVAAGKTRVSIANVGGADGTVLGVTIKPGETVEFIAGNYDTLSVIAFNGTGTELLITTVE